MSSVKQTRFMSFVFLSLPLDNAASLSGDERCALAFSCSVSSNAILSIFFLQKWNISRSDCLELELRTSFVGTYNEHQCGIRVRNARPSDSGIWGCEMESYKFGGGRGSGFIVRGGVEVYGIPFLWPLNALIIKDH